MEEEKEINLFLEYYKRQKEHMAVPLKPMLPLPQPFTKRFIFTGEIVSSSEFSLDTSCAYVNYVVEIPQDWRLDPNQSSVTTSNTHMNFGRPNRSRDGLIFHFNHPILLNLLTNCKICLKL